MEVVEQIIFTRKEVLENGTVITASATYLPGGDDESLSREKWSQEKIDAIGDTLIVELDKEIDVRKQLLEARKKAVESGEIKEPGTEEGNTPLPAKENN